MTDTNYLYQYFLEKSAGDEKAKIFMDTSEKAKTKNVKKKTKEDKNHE